jgi:nitrogen fixation NifU-like protein
MELDELYQEILLDHFRHPRNKCEIAEADAMVEEENPNCGDRIRIVARVKDGVVDELRYDNAGCAISMASASMLSEFAKGRPLAEVQAAIRAFAAAMRGEAPYPAFDYEDLAALEGVKKFPLRVKCATMAWHALDKALARG